MNISSSVVIKIAVACFGISLLITDFAMAQETHDQSVATSHTSKWGPYDEIGAMNYLTPAAPSKDEKNYQKKQEFPKP